MLPHPEPRPGSEAVVLGRRIAAMLIDTVVVFLVYYIGLLTLAGVVFRGLGPPLSIFNYLFWFVLNVLGLSPLLSLHGESWLWFVGATLTWALYGGICETVRGQTVGKALTGIVVVRTDGAPVSVGDAFVRNLIRVIDGLLYYFVGLVVLSLSADKQRLGDHLADTLVLGVKKSK